MRRLPALIACVPALVLTACNRGEVVRVNGSTVAITLKDYRELPQRVRVRPGRITFVVHNASRQPHSWQLERRGRRRGQVATLLPGETGRLRVRLRRGAYRTSCGLGHDDQLGEHGTVSVR
jgi:hypothetical protein